jgi:hypothetical protein
MQSACAALLSVAGLAVTYFFIVPKNGTNLKKVIEQKIVVLIFCTIFI